MQYSQIKFLFLFRHGALRFLGGFRCTDSHTCYLQSTDLLFTQTTTTT